jgi:EAL domain-containing protein (putative c-di-GMP-specific phosphodiesterase class I)
VNLSARQLQHPDLAADVAAALAASGLPPELLVLELTETTLLGDPAGAGATLAALRALGVRLALDDFGTGYSSLGYLRRLPVDILKIDKGFLAGVGHDPADTAVVGAVVTLARTLGLRTVAEGIETAEQLAALRALGCDVGQGWHFARALPPEGLEAFLAGERPDDGALRA